MSYLHFVTPKVYLTGYTSIDLPGLTAYLQDTDQLVFLEEIETARQEGLSDGEILCSFYAKLCYASLSVGKNRNITRVRAIRDNLAGTIDSGHGSVFEHAQINFVVRDASRVYTHEQVRHRVGSAYCLSGDTLIYSDHKANGRRKGVNKRRLRDLYEMNNTPHGRSRIRLLRLRCLDEKTGQFTTGKVSKILYSGVKPLFKVTLEDGKQITCSKDHRFLTESGWHHLDEIVGGLNVSRGGLAVHGELDQSIAVNGQLAYRDREWLEQKYNVENLTQKAIAVETGASSHTIRSWVRKYGLQKEPPKWEKGHAPWNVGKRYSGGWNQTPEMRAHLSQTKRGEKNPQWRGGVTCRAVTIRRPVKELTKDVFTRDNHTCQMCRVRGGKLTVHHVLPIWAREDLAQEITNLTTLCGGCHRKVNGKELEYAERFGAPRSDVIVLHGRKQPRGKCLFTPKYKRIESVEYVGEDETYDIEMAGENHNFVANGVVTHNSQTSGRYVRTDKLNVVIDPILAPAYDLVEEARVYLEGWYKRVEGRLAIADEKSFSRKKKLTSAMRRMLPNGQANELGFSLNLRSIRHLIELRTSEHAEWEIREIYAQVYSLLVGRFPVMFADASVVSKDGLPEITFKNRKI